MYFIAVFLLAGGARKLYLNGRQLMLKNPSRK